MSHTPEPWHTRASWVGPKCYLHISNLDSDESIAYCKEPANASRIVVCVNACAGFTTEALERETTEGHGIIRAFQRQRDELLAALKDCVDLLDGYFKEVGGCDHSVGICMCSDFAVNARAKEVIAKVEADK